MAVCDLNIQPNYFYDELTYLELDALMKNHNEKYKNDWEKVRWLGYINAIASGAKLKKPQDLITFNWELSEENKIERTEESIKQSQQKLIDVMLGSLYK